MSTLLRAAALTLASGLTLLLVSMTALPASAHDEMIEATPSQGAALGADDPQFAAFRFSNAVFPEAAFIAVIDPSGTEVSVGDVTVAGDTVSREFAASAPGTYTASYRVTSSDGHPIEGSVSFTYDGPAAGGPTDEAGAEPSEERGGDGSADDGPTAERDYTTVAVVVVAIAVLVVGTAVAISVARRRRR